jgi:hypothetical protein
MACKTRQVITHGPHIWLVRVCMPAVTPLAQIPCLSARPKRLILQGRFAQFALLRMRRLRAEEFSLPSSLRNHEVTANGRGFRTRPESAAM